ncbi:MAG: DnaA/Hda family protein [Epibacterium sp.]|nr:DnaA/Hda family protein [Epibacterium sp.]NQX74368.1 chromosomal replication initiator DnaA [Epibacterium sp.]
MTKQLSFDLPAKPALEREDFFVAPSNAMAVALLDRNFTWPSGKLVLTGPKGAGKTHLVHVWAAESGARILNARDLRDRNVPRLAQGPVAIEDVPNIAEDGPAQNALFHLHNMVLTEGHQLMLTGRPAPAQWDLGLADLQSRVQAATHAALAPPDDALLSVVLAKLFADRQIIPRPDVIPYLVSRMDRSFAAAQAIVERLDRMAMAEQRMLNRALAIKLMSEDRDF